MVSPSADPPQHHASAPPLLLAIRHLPFPGTHWLPRVFPAPDLARRLDELAAAAAAHPLLKPLFAFHSHLSTFSQLSSRRTMVAMRQAACPLSGEHCFAAVLGDSVAGMVVANGINNFLNLYNTVLVVRLVLTWFPNTPPAIVTPLRALAEPASTARALRHASGHGLVMWSTLKCTICDPYLNIFRGIIPPLGGTLDLSPILAFLVLNAFSSTAAALPAELPNSAVASSSASSPGSVHPDLTANQRKLKSQEEDDAR